MPAFVGHGSTYGRGERVSSFAAPPGFPRNGVLPSPWKAGARPANNHGQSAVWKVPKAMRSRLTPGRRDSVRLRWPEGSRAGREETARLADVSTDSTPVWNRAEHLTFPAPSWDSVAAGPAPNPGEQAPHHPTSWRTARIPTSTRSCAGRPARARQLLDAVGTSLPWSWSAARMCWPETAWTSSCWPTFRPLPGGRAEPDPVASSSIRMRGGCSATGRLTRPKPSVPCARILAGIPTTPGPISSSANSR